MEEVVGPFNYGSPPRSPEQQGASTHTPPLGGTPPPYSPGDAEGTPKVPLVPFGGPVGRPCPPAPRKGRAPSNFYDNVSGEAPVRRLSFGAGGSEGCVSPEPAGDCAMDGMDEDSRMDQELQHQQQHWPQQQQHSPAAGAAAAQPSHLRIPPQPQNQDLLLSPSPPPMQQLFSQQQQQQPLPEQSHRPGSVQQQLFAPAPPPGSGCHLRPQQLWPSQQPQPQQLQPQQLFGQAQQQQQVCGNPMSPAGAPRPPTLQGNTTPARLFR